MKLEIKIVGSDGKTRAEVAANDFAALVYDKKYEKGDVVTLSTDEPGSFLMVRLEDSMAPALCYMKGKKFSLEIPFDEGKIAYSPKNFMGEIHILSVRAARKAEVDAYKNLSHNLYDNHGNNSLYPHVSANVETRNEAVFAARNAVDGFYGNVGHGPWPYQSWGISQRDDAEIRTEFGRKVKTDCVYITIRADFPHDNWWVEGTVRFSDGSTVKVRLEKEIAPQEIKFLPRVVEWAVLEKLVRADDPSPFPALTQLEFWGTEEK